MNCKSKNQDRGNEFGAEIADEIKSLVSAFEEVRVSKLQSALLESFSQRLDDTLEEHGVDPQAIKIEFAKLDSAWQAGLHEMKRELLEFSNMQGWLECAEAIGARGDALDFLERQFNELTSQLRMLAVSAVGGRVLAFGL